MKIIAGRNDSTTFLPLSHKMGGQINNYKPNVGQYLTRKQANHVHKKTELGQVINAETLQQIIRTQKTIR